jgi:hypothetical protein
VSHIDPDMIALIALGESALPGESEHIRGCVLCQSEVDQLSAVAASARAVTVSDRPVAPPAQVWDRIEAELGTQLWAAPARTGTKTRRTSRGMFALAASVGVLVGGLGTYLAVSTDTSDSRATIVAQASLAPLRDVKEPAQASVQQINGGHVLNVQASGLPATDGFYEVWLLAPDAVNMISVGMLDASEGGAFPLPAGIDLAAYPIVDISLEHFDGVTTHSSDSILRGKLTI